MSIKLKLHRVILLVLNQCDGVPMPENVLVDAAALLLRVEAPTRDDIADALKDVEAAGYAAGLSDDIAGRSWTLTVKGTHKARQLR